MQKIPFGVDPKTIICAFYEAEPCGQHNMCKFSYNPDVERKGEERGVYDNMGEQVKI
jgi:hypothetical protein